MAFEAEFLYSDCTGMGGAHCATLAVLREKGLLAVWYVYPEEETHGGRIVLARRASDSTPWTTARPLPLSVSGSLGNPVVFEAPDGVIHLHFVALSGPFWDTAAWYQTRSTDGGTTFETASRVSPIDGLMIRHGPVFRDDGTALLPVYSDRTKRSFLYTSRPPYTSWSEGYSFDPAPVIQGSLVDAGSRLVMFFRPSDARRHPWRSTSSDGGRTWSDPVRMTLPNPLSGIAAFAHAGRIGLVYNHTERHERFPLSVAMSSGNLSDWGPQKSIDASEFEVSYPSFGVDANGRIHGVFTYNRRFIKYVSFDGEWLDAEAA